MGETVTSGCFLDRWRVRIGSALAFAESVRLDGGIAHALQKRAIAAGGVAVASVLKIPGHEADVEAIRAMQPDFAGEAGASTWNGLTLIRCVAVDGAALRHDVMMVLTALGGMPVPRLWMN
jgi:urease accessory protein